MVVSISTLIILNNRNQPKTNQLMKNLITAFALMSLSAFGQVPIDSLARDSLFTEAIDVEYFYAPLDKTQITSGILLDKYLYLYGRKPEIGDTLSADQYHALYVSIYQSALYNPKQFVDPDALWTKELLQTESVIPLSFMFMKYDKIKENALEDGLLEYRNGQLHDVPGRPETRRIIR